MNGENNLDKKKENDFSIQQKKYEESLENQEKERILERVSEGNFGDSEVEKEEESPQKITRPSVKTYRDFAIKALKGNPTSLAKMIIKEKKKEEIDYEYSPKNKKNILMIFVSLALIILGVLAVGSVVIFSINKKNQIAETEKPLAPKSLIYFDYKKENELDNLSRLDIVKIAKNAIENTNIPIGNIKIFYFVKRKDSGYKRLATAREFFDILDTRAPANFTRNLDDDFTAGIISTVEKTSPFLILKIREFDFSYSSILAWENSILLDLGDIFSVNKNYYAQRFSDLGLYNKDTRVILDDEGRVVFGYSFVDLRTLIFFTDTDSFRKIITLLQSKKEKK